MEPKGTVTRMIQQLRSDDPVERDVAATFIWEKYFQKLLNLARANLDQRIRQRVDEEDIVQSMYKSFCNRQQEGGFELKDSDDLWRLLVRITLNKTANAANRNRSEKRDVCREQPLSGLPGEVFEEMDASEPTPGEAIVLNEALELRLQGLQDPELRRIALARMAGYTIVEIAAQANCSVRRIERKLKMIRDRWDLQG